MSQERKRRKNNGADSGRPAGRLEALAEEAGFGVQSPEFAAFMDDRDPLRAFRSLYHIPQNKMLPLTDTSLVDGDADCVYLCGNSLGLQPKRTQQIVDEELVKWQRRGVIGHFDDSPRPWVSIEQTVNAAMTRVVGARAGEVVVMNSLTANLHLMMCSFYVPTAARNKIVIEKHAFPSDHYAVESQLRLHGYDPATHLVLVEPRAGEETLRTADILAVIEEQGDSVALVMLSGVQYYTGQLFRIREITAAGQRKGCMVGWDLAHAVGNAELRLHDDGVDFACWCSYKYLNSGPGGIAGAFVHEKHNADDRPRLLGWWGHREKTRFNMSNSFEPITGAGVYQLSNPPVLQTVSLLASLELFDETSMRALNEKTFLLTGFLEYLITHELNSQETTTTTPATTTPAAATETETETAAATTTATATVSVDVITPADPEERGCQLSLRFNRQITKVHEELEKRGVVCDKREPSVLRIAPTPMYNTFADVRAFVDRLKECVKL